MSPKMKNFIVRAITGALFVAIMVAGLLDLSLIHISEPTRPY